MTVIKVGGEKYSSNLIMQDRDTKGPVTFLRLPQ